MSANCNYSNKYYPLVKFKKDTLSKEEFETWVKNTFKDGTSLLSRIARGTGDSSSPSTVEELDYIPSIARAILSSDEKQYPDLVELHHSHLPLIQ